MRIQNIQFSKQSFLPQQLGMPGSASSVIDATPPRFERPYGSADASAKHVRANFLPALKSNRLRFGSLGEHFDVNRFLKDESEQGLAAVLRAARAHALGKTVTFTDVVYQLLKDFQADVEAYEAHVAQNHRTEYGEFSFLGSQLGFTRNAQFRAEKKRLFEELPKKLTELEAWRAQSQVPEAKRTQRFDQVLEASLSDLVKVFDEVGHAASGGDKKASDLMAQGLLPDQDMLIQIWNGTSTDPAVKLLQDVARMLSVRYKVPVQRFLPESVRAKQIVSVASQRPVDVTAEIQNNPVPVIPGISEDVNDIVRYLNQPNQTPVLVIAPPTLIQTDIVKNLAARVQQLPSEIAQDEPVQDGFIKPGTKVFMIDFVTFSQTAKKEEVFGKLQQTIQELSAQNDGVIINLVGFESVLQEYGIGARRFLDRLMADQQTKIMITVDEKFMDHTPHPQFVDHPQHVWATNFETVQVERPLKRDLITFLEAADSPLKTRCPSVQFAPDAIKEAVDAAYRKHLILPEGAVSVLSYAAQAVQKRQSVSPKKSSEESSLQMPSVQVTLADVKRVIENGQALRSPAHADDKELYTPMSPEELKLDLPPEVIGLDNIKGLFETMRLSMFERADLEAYQVPLTKAAIIQGAGPGSGKTMLIKKLAVDANVPLLYVDGANFTGRDLNAMANGLERVIMAARKLSARREEKGLSPVVLIGFDNLEKGIAQSSNGPVEGALSHLLAKQLRELNQDGNQNLFVLGVMSSNAGMVRDFADTKVIQVQGKMRPLTPDQALALIQQVMAQKEKTLDKTLFVRPLDSKALGLFFAYTAQTISELIDETIKWKLKTSKEKDWRISPDDLHRVLINLAVGGENEALLSNMKYHQLEGTAYHETGHAGMEYFWHKKAQYPWQYAGAPKAVSVMPQGTALGVTFTDNYDPHSIGQQSRTQMFNEICMLTVSRSVERAVYGENATGVSNDQERATKIAKVMSSKYRMGDNWYSVAGGISDEALRKIPAPVFKAIYKDVKKLLRLSEQVGDIWVKHYKEFLVLVKNELIGKGPALTGKITLSGEQFAELYEQFDQDHLGVFEACAKEIDECIAESVKEKDDALNLRDFFKPTKLTPTERAGGQS